MDKLTIERQTLENIANAVRNKNHESNLMSPSQIVTAINNLEIEEGYEWKKPNDWPDIETLPLVDNSTMSLYLLFDCTTNLRYLRLEGLSNNYSYTKYQKGKDLEWISFTNSLEMPTDCNYIIVKVWTTANNVRLIFSNSNLYGLYSSSNSAGSNQTCLWMYGKITPNVLSDMYANQSGGFSTIHMQRVHLYVNSNVGYGYGWSFCPKLRSLIIEGFNNERFIFVPKTASRLQIIAPKANIIIGKCTLGRGLIIPELCKSIIYTDVLSETALEINQNSNSFAQVVVIHGFIPISSFSTFFRYYQGIKKMDISAFDLSDCQQIFRFIECGCALTELRFGINFAKNIDISKWPLLTHESLIDFIEKLAVINETHTVTLGNINKSKLTSQEIAIATNKGWTVV